MNFFTSSMAFSISSGFLTNSAHVVAANNDGTGYNLSSPAAGGTFEIGVSKSLTNGAWTSLDIPLSEFDGFVASGGNLDQIKYEVGTDGTASGNKSFFLDNIYVH